MTTRTAPPSLVPPTTSNRYYFAHAETETFRGRYAAVLAPYAIDPATVTTSDGLADVAHLIYVAAQ